VATITRHYSPVLKTAGVSPEEAEIEWSMLKKEVNEQYDLKSIYLPFVYSIINEVYFNYNL